MFILLTKNSVTSIQMLEDFASEEWVHYVKVISHHSPFERFLYHFGTMYFQEFILSDREWSWILMCFVFFFPPKYFWSISGFLKSVYIHTDLASKPPFACSRSIFTHWILKSYCYTRPFGHREGFCVGESQNAQYKQRMGRNRLQRLGNILVFN